MKWSIWNKVILMLLEMKFVYVTILTCDEELHCNSCSYRNDCLWQNDLCISNSNSNNDSKWYERIKGTCPYNKQNEYCGNINTIDNTQYTLSLPEITSQYGTSFLFCSYNIPLPNVSYSIISTQHIHINTNIQLNYIISYTNNTIAHLNISHLENHPSLYLDNITSFQIVFYTNNPLHSSPFTIDLTFVSQIEQHSQSSTKKHSLLITMIAVIIAITLSFLIPYICCVVLKRNNNSQHRHSHRQIEHQTEIKSTINKLEELFTNELKGKTYEHDITLNDNNVCTICLDKLNPKTLISQIKCGHVFHEECLKCWLMRNVKLHPRCPNCNGEIIEMYEHKDEQGLKNENINITIEQNPRTRANSRDTEQEMLGTDINNNNNNNNNNDVIQPTVIVIQRTINNIN